MYSFQPLPDYSDIHTGFYVLSVFCVIAMALVLAVWKSDDIETPSLMCWIVILGGLLTLGYKDSYADKHPLNEQHIGIFVGFDAEGYRERSGKTTVDRHYTYVIYNVDGNPVMFPAQTGMPYPKRIVVYKN
jgi:hypothetical protein